MPARRHVWTEAGRTPVELVRYGCSCGCRQTRVSIVGPGGRAISFHMPSVASLAKVDPGQVSKFVAIGRELLGFAERLKAAVG